MANDDSFKRPTTVRFLYFPRFNKKDIPYPYLIWGFFHFSYRFASFIEGGSHLNDDEILEYETTQLDIDDEINTDDEDLMTDSDSDK